QNLELPPDPAKALASLAVWNPAQPFAEDRTGGAEDCLCACEGNAPDEKGATGLSGCGHSLPPFDWDESNDTDTILWVCSSGKAFARVSLAFFRILRSNQ